MNGLMDSLGIAASSLDKVHFRQNPHQMDSFMYPREIVTIPLPPELTQLLNKQKSSPIHQPAGIFHLQLIKRQTRSCNLGQAQC